MGFLAGGIMKNNYLLGLVTGIAMLVAMMIVNALFNMLFPSLGSEYVNAVFRPWTDQLMMAFFLYPFALGFALTYIWNKTRKSWKSGLEFGLTMALAMAIPSFIVNYSSFTFSLQMITSWVLSGLIITIVAGLVLGKFEG